jgi:hypothetical protein
MLIVKSKSEKLCTPPHNRASDEQTTINTMSRERPSEPTTHFITDTRRGQVALSTHILGGKVTKTLSIKLFSREKLNVINQLFNTILSKKNKIILDLSNGPHNKLS